MASNYTFQGWMGLDKTAAQGNMVWQSFTPKPFAETDVDIKITHCGICGSDLHTLRSGWGAVMYPVCVGHEIVGTAVRVGSQVENGIKVGDRVGVGAQSGSCLRADCEQCAHGEESYCQVKQTGTYNSKWPDGSKSYGGYGDYWRGHSHFVFKIPDALPSDVAAPMLCGGITAFSPLTQHGAGPGKRVGIIGMGGLGHFGVMGAKALGVDHLLAISRGSAKRTDALKMGADAFVATDEDKDWVRKHRQTLDLIVCTVSSPKMPLARYLQLLRVGGVFVQIGAPEDAIPAFNAFSLISKKIKITGSSIGSPKEIREMLDLFAAKKVWTWNNNYPLKEANRAIVDMEDGKARYRIVLVNEKHLNESRL
jgi:alcohol dehydrogenase (NADP+)